VRRAARGLARTGEDRKTAAGQCAARPDFCDTTNKRYVRRMIAGALERLFHFVGGDAGPWRVVSNRAVLGEGLAPADDVARLRATEEWNYVEREVDVRVVRED
jgi:hypothetical protein